MGESNRFIQIANNIKYFCFKYDKTAGFKDLIQKRILTFTKNLLNRFRKSLNCDF